MSRILISGYYGFNNAGDDSVLFGIISSLKKQDDSIDLTILSNQPEETEQLFGYRACNRWNIKEIVREMQESDLLLMGGGSLLQDATSPRSVIYYLGLVLLAKLMSKPVAFYAQGIGPIENDFSKRLIKLIVNWVDVITVRDLQSGKELESYGVKKVPIHITADPAATINPDDLQIEQGKELLRLYKVDPDKKSVAISVRHWKEEKNYKKVIAKAADDLINNGWNVIFLPMQYPNDLEASVEIKEQMDSDKAIVIDQQLNFKEIICVIAQMDFVLGMRLHSIILSAIVKVPFLGISYDPKIDRFVEMLQMKCCGNIGDLTYEKLSKYINEEIAQLDKRKQEIEYRMPAIVQAAENSCLLTLDVLEESKSRDY